MTATTKDLWDGLSKRPLPYLVAHQVIEVLGLSGPEAAAFPRKPAWADDWKSSMADAWEHPASLDKPLAVLAHFTRVPAPDGLDAAKIEAYLDLHARPLISGEAGKTSFKRDRLDRKTREARGLDLSRRRYDKLFRLVGRIEQSAAELRSQWQMTRLARFAKVGFAADAPKAAFLANPTSAAFVAYYCANLGRRSLFTTDAQARALDAAAAMLLGKCEADPGANWFAVAHVLPRWDVLARLTVEERIDLLDKARAVLAEVASLLHGETTKNANLDVTNMVVRRGDDSSTWNALAGAWNKARDLWLAAAWSIDPALADAYLPGKVLRLMAADVAAWHRAKGGGLDPDTKVWQVLPRPWLVFDGAETCTRADIIAACESVGVDPAKSGWAKPRPRSTIDEVRVTPETVHGVIVGHPELARLLRRAGYFSGKPGAKPLPIPVERDEYGFAIGVAAE